MSNEMLNLIRQRRSIRNYEARQIPASDLDAILEAGCYAPSAMNEQPWRFTVLQDSEVRSWFLQTCRRALHKDDDFDPFYGAPTIVLVSAKKDAIAPQCDASLAMENMFLAAASLGIGSCWIHCVNDVFASPEGEALKQRLHIPADHISVGSCILGYSAEGLPAPKPRQEGVIVKF